MLGPNIAIEEERERRNRNRNLKRDILQLTTQSLCHLLRAGKA